MVLSQSKLNNPLVTVFIQDSNIPFAKFLSERIEIGVLVTPESKMLISMFLVFQMEIGWRSAPR